MTKSRGIGRGGRRPGAGRRTDPDRVGRLQLLLTFTAEQLEEIKLRARQGGISPEELARDIVIGGLRDLYVCRPV